MHTLCYCGLLSYQHSPGPSSSAGLLLTLNKALSLNSNEAGLTESILSPFGVS